MPWNTRIPSTSSTPLSSSECRSLPSLESFFTPLNTEFLGSNPLFSSHFTLHVDCPSQQGTTDCSVTEHTKPLGQCGCFTLSSVQPLSKIQPSSGAAITDVITSRPMKKKTHIQSRKVSCGLTWDGLWSTKEKRLLSMLKICRMTKSSHGKTATSS